MENSLYISSPGQSGNVLSPHYDDLLGMWASGNYIQMRTTGYLTESVQNLNNK